MQNVLVVCWVLLLLLVLGWALFALERQKAREETRTQSHRSTYIL